MMDGMMERVVQHQKLTVNEVKLLLKKLDIEAFLKSNKIEYRDVGDNENPQFLIHTCPFCLNINHKGNEHPNRLYIGKNNMKFHCYNCGVEGIFLKFAAKIERLSFRNLFDKYLGEGVFESLPDKLSEFLDEQDVKRKVDQEFPNLEMPKEFIDIWGRAQPKYKQAYQYMINRGMTVEGRQIYRNLDIRYCDSFDYKTPSGKIHTINKRLIFPIYWQGKMVGFQGRDITGLSQLKYYISEGLPKRRIIYNYENIKNAETIVIVEGIIDLIKCWHNNPICVFGSFLSNEQLILLQSLPNLKNIVIGLDTDTKIPDKKGNIKYNKLVDQLKPFWNILEIEIPEGKDLGDCSFKEASLIINKAKPLKKEKLTSVLL